MLFAILIVVGYLAGSIPAGYWLVRVAKGTDIRTVGSGNVGATNVWRTYGRNYGLPVMLFDVAKGFVPALVATLTVSHLAGAGLDTLAVRQPAHPLAQALLEAFGGPVVAPSANRSGRVSPTTAEHVRAEFDGADVQVLDGGPCAVGVESTVLDLSGPDAVLLRPGGVPLEALVARLGAVTTHATTPDAPRSPGQLLSHYAPTLPVRLSATVPRPGEALLSFGDVDPTGFAAVFALSPSGDPVEAAARLFAGLRALDRPCFTAIAVSPIPDAGLGLAINNRLGRAAADRPD